MIRSHTHTHMPHTIKRKTVLTTKSNVINFIFIIITLHICWRLTLSLHHSDTMMTTTKTTHIFAIVIFILNAFIWYTIFIRILFWAKFIPFYSIATLLNIVHKTNSFFASASMNVSLCTYVYFLDQMFTHNIHCSIVIVGIYRRRILIDERFYYYFINKN